MAYTEMHVGERQIIGFSPEVTYTTRVAPTLSLGRKVEWSPTDTNVFERSQPAGKDTLWKKGYVKTREDHGGSLSFDLVWGRPLRFIGSTVYNRQIGGAGSNYNHLTYFTNTMSSFSLDVGMRHTTDLNLQYTSAYMKSLRFSGADGEFVRVTADCGAYDVTDTTTIPSVTALTGDPFLFRKSTITVEGSSVAYITAIDVTITRMMDESRNLSATAEYLQTEPAATQYEVTGTMSVKVADKTFWDYLEGTSLTIAALSEINNNVIQFTKNATSDKILLAFGDLHITSDNIPSSRDNVLSQEFAFESVQQATVVSSTTTSTVANKLVDTGSTFPVGTEGALIHNTTDDTWAVVTDREGANTLYLSADIMTSGEGYDIFRGGVSINSVDQVAAH